MARNTVTAKGGAKRNIGKAEEYFALGDESNLKGWYALALAFAGLSAVKAAQAYIAHPDRKTKASVSSVSQYLSAINRAVAKYGTIAKADAAFVAWCADESKGRRERKGGISDFLEFAPAGQRAKSTKSTKSAPKKAYNTVTITVSSSSKALRAAGLSPAVIALVHEAYGLTK